MSGDDVLFQYTLSDTAMLHSLSPPYGSIRGGTEVTIVTPQLNCTVSEIYVLEVANMEPRPPQSRFCSVFVYVFLYL